MEDKSLQAFLNGFTSPAWILVSIGVPMLTNLLIKKLQVIADAKWKFADDASSSPDLPPQPSTQRASGRTAEYFASIINTIVKFIRPLFLLSLLPIVLMGFAGFAFMLFSGKFNFTAFLYVLFYLCIISYNTGRMFGASDRPTSGFGKWIRIFSLAGLAGHVVLILFLLIHQSFYNLFVFMAPVSKMDGLVPVWFIGTVMLANIIVMRDLMTLKGRDEEALIWILAACACTYIFLFINLLYQVF